MRFAQRLSRLRRRNRLRAYFGASAHAALGIDCAALLTGPARRPRRQRVEASHWTQCICALEAELPEQQFNTWVRPLQVLEGAGALKLFAPNRFVVDWVNANL